MTVECMICGKEFKYLGKYIKSKHGITTKDYLKQFPDASLGVNPMQRSEIAKKNSINQKKYYKNHPEVCEERSENRKKFLRSHPEENKFAVDNPMKNPEIAKKVSEGLTGRICSEEHRRHLSERDYEWMKGNKNPMRRPEIVAKFMGDNNPSKRPEVRKKLSELQQGKVFTESHLKNLRISHGSEKSRSKKSKALKGRNNYWMKGDKNPMKNHESCKLVSDAQKYNWENPEFIKKMFKAFNVRPNKPETRLNNILQFMLPGEYKYNGGYECGISLARKIPDFVNVNGKKKAIELYGDYWHEGDDPQERIDLFKQYGYDTLVIWEHELEHSRELVAKIMKFENLPYKKLGQQLSLFDL